MILTFQLMLIIITVMIFLVVGVIVFIKRHDILSWFQPQNYLMVEMIQKDNNTESWLQRKNEKLSFWFDKCEYFMMDNPESSELDKDGKPIQKTSLIYREGRLGKFFYIEGYQFPVKIMRGSLDGANAKLMSDMKKINLNDLFAREESIGEQLLKNIGIFILLGILILILYLIFKKPEPAETAAKAILPMGLYRRDAVR